MDPNALWSWSFLLWRSTSLEMRVSWMVGVVVLFQAAAFLQAGHPWLIPFALVIFPGAILVHALAHIGMARLVGGSCDLCVLSVLNEIASLQVPMNAAKQMVVAAIGPLVSLVLGLASALSVQFVHDDFWATLLQAVARTNLMLCFVNLFACSLFDGARLWRAVLWPLVGLSRAIRATNWLAYGSAGFFLVYGVWTQSWLLFLLGVFCMVATVSEHRSIRLGFDPVLQIEPEYFINRRRPDSWWSRWQARRRVRAQERIEQQEALEQETLDRLLAKVSVHGLPALTEAERGALQAISRKQRARQESPVP
jgi:Zn-dependent protease